MNEVNKELGNDVSRMLYEASKLTQQNRPGLVTEHHESFSGFRAIDGAYFGDISNHYLNIGLDGVGTKVEVYERIEDHSGVAHDLFAMICDDAAVRGAEPLAVGSILDVRHLNDDEHTKTALEQISEGYVGAAEAAGVVVTNGETAELGDRIGGYPTDAEFHFRGKPGTPFNYNWGGVVLWLAHKDRVLTGHDIEPGDSLIGLAERGFRSNGYSDLRKIMRQEYGENWHTHVERSLGELTLGELAAIPSTIYSRLINELTGGYDSGNEPKAKISGAGPITGGGQPEKLGRMLEPSGLGAVIDDPIEPPALMKHVQGIGGYSDLQAYDNWHMGPGVVIATPEPSAVLEVASIGGWGAKRIGEVTKKPEILIENRGAQSPGTTLVFN